MRRWDRKDQREGVSVEKKEGEGGRKGGRGEGVGEGCSDGAKQLKK